MRNIITILLLLVSGVAFGQGTINFGASRSTDTGLTKGQLKFSAYANSNTNNYLTVNSNGYVVFGVPAGGGSAGDSTVFFTVYRGDTMRLGIYSKIYADSLLLALQIETLNSDVTVLDSALGVAFGAISALYDTLLNYVDTAMLNDSLAAIKAAYVPYVGATADVNIGTHTFTAKDGVFNHSSGAGTTLSVTKGGNGEALTVNKTSGSGNAMSVTGGVTLLDELHTTTPIADAYIASAATWNAKGDGTVTSIQLVAGTGVTITPTTAVTTSGTYTISATGGGGGGSPTLSSPYELLYQSGTDTIKSTPKVYVDTTDNRLVLAYDSTNSTVVADPNGGVKIWGSTRMGMSSIRILDTVSIPAALQRSINMQTASLMFPVISGSISYSNNYLYGGMVQTVGTFSYVVAGYNSTIQHLNYNKTLITAAAGAGSNALIRIASIANSAGLICGNNKFSGGGGRGTFTCSFPTYLSTERIMIGYVGKALGALTGDPTTVIQASSTPALLLVKDAADTELQFLHFNGSGILATKVSTGITPNNEDVYRITIYIAPNSTYYMQLEVLSKTGTQTVTFHPETNVPAVGDRMVTYQAVNNGTAGGVVSYGLIQHIEEVY